MTPPPQILNPRIAPRKTPRQERARFIVEAMLEAAARVLETETLEGFNTNRVAAVAGVSVGSLYQYFPNKEALLAALIAQSQADLAVGIRQAMAQATGVSLREGLYQLVRVVIAHHTARPKLAAILEYQERQLPMGAVLEDTAKTLYAQLVVFLRLHQAEIKITDFDCAALDLMTITRALIDAGVTDTGTVAAKLEDRVVQAALGYLTYQAE